MRYTEEIGLTGRICPLVKRNCFRTCAFAMESEGDKVFCAVRVQAAQVLNGRNE